MCNVCGCSDGELRIDGVPQRNSHRHHHHRDETVGHHLHYGKGPAGLHVPGHSQSQLLRIEQDILSKNDAFAAANRARLRDGGILALNLMSSPGAGKTTLLEATLARLKDEMPVAVIEGDQETANDAERIRRTGVAALQVNTGRGCHLDAHMIGHALDGLRCPKGGVLFIENVGNLVCPATFDLGETGRVAILSVTEGDDKPLKYPDMFAAADLMVLSKVDLLPHVDFDVSRCVGHARDVNPEIETLEISARTGDGIEAWLDWVRDSRRQLSTGNRDPAGRGAAHA
jgi:hydrogenase nickel incorporation protein HypB